MDKFRKGNTESGLHHPLYSHINITQIKLGLNLKLYSHLSTDKPSRAVHPRGSPRSLWVTAGFQDSFRILQNRRLPCKSQLHTSSLLPT